jgi:hypothetical protein
MLAYNIQTLGNYPEESIQQGKEWLVSEAELAQWSY